MMIIMIISFRPEFPVNHTTIGGDDADAEKRTADISDLNFPLAFPDSYSIGQDFAGVGIDDGE